MITPMNDHKGWGLLSSDNSDFTCLTLDETVTLQQALDASEGRRVVVFVVGGTQIQALPIGWEPHSLLREA